MSERKMLQPQSDCFYLPSIREMGAIKFIVNTAGEKISDGFQDLGLLETVDVDHDPPRILRAVIGIRGASRHVVKIPTDPDQYYETITTGHQSVYVQHGQLFGFSGAVAEALGSFAELIGRD